MRTEDFDFSLPSDLIAQEPADRRDQSRLLVLNRDSGRVAHRHFCDLPVFLRAGDVLVLNDSRVIPARLRNPAALWPLSPR
jgi:S-adenosylmethionine:tRNA ribosyltransferase-isomerase